MPTCATPWLPPPERTNATRGRSARGARSEWRNAVVWARRIARSSARVGGGLRTISPLRRACHNASEYPGMPGRAVRRIEKGHAYTPRRPLHALFGAARDRVLPAVPCCRGLCPSCALDGGRDARRGPIATPRGPTGREVPHLRVGLRPAPAVRPGERPLLQLRAALRGVRRRGRLHLPVGDRRREPRLVRARRDDGVRRRAAARPRLRLAQGIAQVGL